MKTKTIVLILLLVGVVISPVAADSQVDIGVNVPAVIGVTYQGETVSENIPVWLPIPDVMFNYFFEIGPLKAGIGARVWTIILATGAYPIVSAEFETKRLVLNANLGGGVFGYLTVAPEVRGIETGKVFLPEVSAAFRFTEWFSLGAAVLGVWLPEVTNEGMGYTINLFGRFRVR